MLEKALEVVELFCGIGGFRIACDAVGAKTIWANDFNPKSCKVYRNNFGANEIIEWDINDVIRNVPSHDLLTAGFPCQPFSAAGKKEGTRDPRGTLFQSIVDVLTRTKPNYFVLENVKRLLHMEDGAHFATIVSSLAELDYRIEWRVLNAVDFGLAQNRQRVFIIGTKKDLVPENAVKLLQAHELNDFSFFDASTVSDISNWKKISTHGKQFEHWGLAQDGRFITKSLESFQPVLEPVILASVLENEVSDKFYFNESTKSRILDSRPVQRFVDGVEILSNQGGGARMGYTIFGINGVAPTLTASTSRHYERYKINDTYRRLTNIEYARLQGFPDEHCKDLTLYDQYEAYGNAVPPIMAQWVIERVLSEGYIIEETNDQLAVFA